MPSKGTNICKKFVPKSPISVPSCKIFMPPERVLCLKLESVDLYNRRATQKSGPLPRKKVSLGEAGGAAGMAPKKAKPRAAAKAEAKDLCKETEGCIPPHATRFGRCVLR